jgi:hypothetical protein
MPSNEDRSNPKPKRVRYVNIGFVGTTYKVKALPELPPRKPGQSPFDLLPPRN